MVKKKQKIRKRIEQGLIVCIVLCLILIGVLFVLTRNAQDAEREMNFQRANQGLQLHIHPTLRIVINNKPVPIPAGIGISIGRVTDLQVSGTGASPIHTHDNSGELHIEMVNPSTKPEVLTLGYFFYIWGQRFNKNCIFDYCTDKGTLRMFVDGKESNEFQNYSFQGNENILINYTSTEVKP